MRSGENEVICNDYYSNSRLELDNTPYKYYMYPNTTAKDNTIDENYGIIKCKFKTAKLKRWKPYINLDGQEEVVSGK